MIQISRFYIKSFLSFVIIALIVLSVGCAETSRINSGVNILIMGEDADPSTVARNNRVFKRVLSALSNELNDEGFSVYDESAITTDLSSQERTRRDDDEIIDVARSVKHPPIDIAVIFAIYTDTDKTAYSQKIYARIEGRLINVPTGQRLGNFEVEIPGPVNARLDCQGDCILEKVGENARGLAQDLGAILTTKLAHLTQRKLVASPSARSAVSAYSPTSPTTPLSSTNRVLPSAYVLIFNGFTPSEITQIENNIVEFNGYSHHRPITSSLRQIEYWYETESGSAKINRSLREMLKRLGVKGRLTFSGQRFLLQKIGSL